MTFIRVVVMNIVFTENDWFKCHLCFISFLGTSIYPSIHLVTHPLFNMSMASFNNQPDQSVSKPVYFEESNWLIRKIVESSSLPIVWSLVHKTLHHPSIHPKIYSVIQFLICQWLLSTIFLISQLLSSKWTG